MHVAEAVLRLVVADASGADGVGEEALAHTQLAERLLGRQAKLLQRPDLRVDDEGIEG